MTTSFDRRGENIDVRAIDIRAGYANGPDVVNGVSIHARAGQVTTLIGPNGCGKSTLLKTLCKLLVPRAGAVEVCGRDIHALKSSEAAKIVALLPQHPTAPDGLSVGELVSRGRHPHRARFRPLTSVDYDAISRACEATSTTELADTNIDELSGGQRQRVWLAMTLAQETPVLLLDEPTTFLDPAHAIEMLILAREQARQGKAVVMVLHDLTFAAQYSDTIIVLNKGRLIAQGTPREALTPEVLAAAYGLRAEVWDDPAGVAPVIVPRGVI